MLNAKKVENQLRAIGFNFRFWGKGEVRELSRVIADDEGINHCCNGHYQGGFAMLVATDQRLLLIDRKPMFLTIEAIWYDKIGQVDYNHRLFNATICISTPNKDLRFTSWNHGQLRGIMEYSQSRMTEAKNSREFEIRQSQAPAIAIVHQAPMPALEPSFIETEIPAATSTPAVATDSSLLHLNIPTPSAATLYAATRLPFSRRRYYATSTPV